MVLDIIVICVLVLFGIIGMVKGFLNTIISLFGNLASLAVAILCAKPVAKFLDKIFGIVSGIGGKIAGSLASSVKPFADGTVGELTGAQLKEYLANDGLSMQERIMKLFIEDSASFTTDQMVVDYIGQRIAAIAALVIAVVVMFIILRLAVFLLAKLFDALTKNRAIGGLDRAMGLIFGLVKGAIIISIVLGVCYLIANEKVNGWIENTTVTKFVYQHVCYAVDWAVNKFDLPATIKQLFPALDGTSGGTTEGGTTADRTAKILGLLR